MHRKVERQLSAECHCGYAIHTPRSVSYLVLGCVESELRDMVDKDVRFKVEWNE